MVIFWKAKLDSALLQKLKVFFTDPTHYLMIKNCLLGLAIFFSFAIVYVSIFVPQALSSLTGWFTYISWAAYGFFVNSSVKEPDQQKFKKVSPFPSWKNLTPRQRRISLVLLIIGLVYFCLFILINLKNSSPLQELCRDEAVQYPVVLKMLAQQHNLRLAFYRFFIYGEYEYGFPFYGLSALLLIPIKAIFGNGFSQQTQLNLLILRQLVCILPTVIAAFIFTYLATRFKKWWTALGLFLIILTLPGVISFQTQFWHPDALNLLFIALTLFYLDRDHLEFGGNFYFAAITCGLSVATRMFGLFFFLAIAVLLLEGILRKRLTFKKAALAGVLFCILMLGTILVSNPYLFKPGEFGAAVRIIQRQGSQVANGINEPDPEGIYQTGLHAWWPFIERFTGSELTIIFLVLSALLGNFAGEDRRYYRILLPWLVVVGGYLIFFVKVKSYWYLLPLLVPLYSAFFAIFDQYHGLKEKTFTNPKVRTAVKVAVFLLIAGIGSFQLFLNIRSILLTYLMS
jgi:4-amino-4-deoxy-L-arabinose transferase-like glycosyltransferase